MLNSVNFKFSAEKNQNNKINDFNILIKNSQIGGACSNPVHQIAKKSQ
jgi:hypothetical protein